MMKQVASLLVLLFLTAIKISAHPPQLPEPGKIQTYKDWIIGCDNTLRCVAQSLPVESDFLRGVRILRDGGPAAGVEISFPAEPQNTMDFLIDGQKVATAVTDKDGVALRGPQAMALARAMARGMTMEMKIRDKVVDRLSLAGSSAALRYMDAQQGRANTTTALVAAGTLNAQTIKPAPPLPTIRRIAPDPTLKAEVLNTQERAALLRLTGGGGCDGDPNLAALSKTQTLVLVSCEGGPYNFPAQVLIASGAAGRRTFLPAVFDFGDNQGSLLYNAGWDPDTGRFSTYYRGRGLGDCGQSRQYVWDGTRFRLIEATEMGECRGSTDWLITYRAAPQP